MASVCHTAWHSVIAYSTGRNGEACRFKSYLYQQYLYFCVLNHISRKIMHMTIEYTVLIDVMCIYVYIYIWWYTSATESPQIWYWKGNIFYNYTPHTTKLLGGILVSLHRSVRLLACSSCIPFQLCSAYSFGWINFVITHLIKQLQKVCHL